MIPYLPEGTVYGTLLNFRREQALWAARMAEPPYQAPPRAPVLYVKTANTFSPGGTAIALPEAVAEVEIGATLGLVMGRAGIAGAVLMNDLSLPHASYYRPPVKYRCLDGLLGIGPRCVPLAGLDALAALKLEARVNGQPVQTVALSDLVRGPARLLADVAEFMSLQPGDMLMLGTDCLADGSRPRVRPGDRVEIAAPGFDALVNTLIREAVSDAGPPQVANPCRARDGETPSLFGLSEPAQAGSEPQASAPSGGSAAHGVASVGARS